MTIGDVSDVRAYIKNDIVKNDLPLLLSHKSLKTAGMLMDLKNDCCQIFGKSLKLRITFFEHLYYQNTKFILYKTMDTTVYKYKIMLDNSTLSLIVYSFEDIRQKY